MPTNKNASSFATATAIAGAAFLARIAGKWVNVPDTLLEGTLKRVSPKTANHTVLATETGMVFTNLGASGAITFALPAATVGLSYRFYVAATQQLRIDPNGSEIITGGTAGQYYWADAIGEQIELLCIEAGKWAVLNKEGTWTFV